jgi:uncharacterized membrane protein AbrB (regulator of aidB expression)
VGALTGAVAVGAVAATGVAGSAAKADTATIVAIRVARVFIIKFPFGLCKKNYSPYIYITR